MKKYLFMISVFFLSCSSDDELINSEWIIVACEGNYGSSNGSIYMINQFGEMDSIPNLGDVVQSVEVNEDKLFVLVNNSHKLHVFDINSDGISLPGIEIDLENSSPREMFVDDDRVYFTNWNSKDVKYLDLFNYKIEKLIDVDGLPEGIVKKDDDIFVAINMNEDYSSSDKVIRYNINNKSTEKINVGDGPLDMEFKNNDLFISRTYYDMNYTAYHGTSQFSINGNIDNVLIKNYGENTPCGGSIHNLNDVMYRSALGGIVELDDLLNLKSSNKIGDFNQSDVYSVEVLGDKVYFGLTDYNNLNQVKVVNIDNSEFATYDVGIIPGDFAIWRR